MQDKIDRKSVVIMNTPENCEKCNFYLILPGHGDGMCMVTGYKCNWRPGKVFENCPLKPLTAELAHDIAEAEREREREENEYWIRNSSRFD